MWSLRCGALSETGAHALQKTPDLLIVGELVLCVREKSGELSTCRMGVRVGSRVSLFLLSTAVLLTFSR